MHAANLQRCRAAILTDQRGLEMGHGIDPAVDRTADTRSESLSEVIESAPRPEKMVVEAVHTYVLDRPVVLADGL